MLFLFLSYWCK